QVGDMRHPAAAPDLRADELREAADVHVLCDLGPGPQPGEGAAVGAVAHPRVLYIDVGADAALGADVRVALQDRERFDDRVLAELFDQAAAVEAVDADVELVDLLALLLRRVLTLDDPVQRSVWLADDPTVVACWVFDAGEGRIGSGRLVRVDDLEDARRGKEGRVAGHDQDLPAAQVAGGDLLQRVGSALRVALVAHLYLFTYLFTPLSLAPTPVGRRT